MTSAQKLEGNGAGLVREMALASRIQRGLERLYRLDPGADVDAFITAAEGDEREALLVRQAEDGAVEIALRVPQLGADGGDNLDSICQIIEGVSHFVYVADRAGRNRETTQLELEVQAEVDKYVVLASSIPGIDGPTSRRLRERLYERVEFTHAEDSEQGERYRLANHCARRFVARLERSYLARARLPEMRVELRRFFHMGQGDKLRAA